MRDRLSRLAPVSRFAERQENDAAEALAKVVGALGRAQRTLNELNGYRDGYVAQGSECANWRSAHLRDYHAFLAKLDQAIAAQRDIVRDAERRCAVVRRLWQDKRMRRKSLSQLTERIVRDNNRAADAAAQKVDDALSLARAAMPGREFR